jgi:hypothetical protein
MVDTSAKVKVDGVGGFMGIGLSKAEASKWWTGRYVLPSYISMIPLASCSYRFHAALPLCSKRVSSRVYVRRGRGRLLSLPPLERVWDRTLNPIFPTPGTWLRPVMAGITS